MRIISIRLQNFRSHKDSFFEFEDGVNLLIGYNGAGKSSILEAIGLTLFDAKSRTANKDVVRRGEKSSTVTIVLLGNDGIVYRVERKYGTSSSWKLFIGDEKSPRLTAKEVLPKLREITGVINNETNLFHNVICAVQNKFTEVFSQSDTKREELFNKLFNTGVYKEIYSQLVGDASIKRTYEDNKLKTEENIKNLIDTTENIDELQLAKKEKSKQKDAVDTSLKELQTTISQLEKEQKEVDSKRNSYEKNTLSLKEKSTLQESLVKQHNETEKNIASAKSAREIIVVNRAKYNEYVSLKEKRESLEKSISHETKVKKDREELQKRLDNTKASIDKLEKEKIVLEGEVRSKKEFVEEKKKYLSEENEKVSKLQAKLDSIKNDGIVVKGLIEKYSTELSELDRCNEVVRTIERDIDSLKKSGTDTKQLKKELENANKQVEELEEKDKQLQETIKDIEVLQSRIEEVESAKKELSTGICPILKESCKNREAGGNSYFEEKISSLEEQLQVLENRKSERISIPALLTKARTDSISINKEIDNTEKRASDIIALQEKLGVYQQKSGVITEKLALIEPNDNYSDFKVRLSTLQTKRETLLEIYSSTEIDLNGVKQKSSDLEKEIVKAANEIEASLKEIENISSIILSEKVNLKKIIELKDENEASLKEIDKIRGEVATVSEKMKTVEEGYELYLNNNDLAGKLDTFITRKEELKSHLYSLEKEIEELRELINNTNIKELNDQIQSMSDTLLTKKNKKDELIEKLTTLKNELENITTRIEAAKKQQNKVKGLKSELKVLERKLELTDLFREKIKNMGRYVAATFVGDIAISATTYYRQITGGNETIEWLIDESKKYEVSLVVTENGEIIRKSFIELSGGEQVAVALAIRTALAQSLAGGDFAIFDEPTINLDKDRKVSLAESIKSMLGTLEQTIIVTHDDVFREMAQKVIELGV